MTDTNNNTNTTETIDLTKEAEEKNKNKKTTENKSNTYTPYWDTSGTDEYRMTNDTPEVHIWVSHQRLGSEDAGKPYDGQTSETKQNTSNDTKKDTTTDTNKTTTEK